mmetsp:Transcript_16531/g.47030  ORF Transcript_16531/g.47030 Transcript_16531/m.47030 type:complete len:339 (+) Transcript_16531:278-1294(+)
MGLETALTKALGIQHPIVQGGMHYVGYAELASAVSNAGGLGIITGLTQPTPEDLRKEIRRCREMTSKPFGVNLTILPVLIPADYDSYMRVICEERVAVVEISGGSPRKYIPALREAGVKVIHKSATIKHALKAQADGVDFIEVAGFESAVAGRASADDVGTWILLAKALGTLSTPVLVSGASATGRQLAAALAMGAQGISMGTRFLATEECPIHRSVKEHLASTSTDEFATTLVLGSFNNSTRTLKNAVTKEILRMEAEMAKQGGGDFAEVAHLAKGDRARVMFQETGDWDSAMWSCSQAVGLINDIPTCKVLLDRMVEEAEAQLSKGASLIRGHGKL